jgi:hypothetical protein
MLFRTVRYTFWQIGLLKLAMLSLGIAIGAYWPEVFLPYLTHLLILTLLLGIYLAVVYFRQ